MTEQPNDPEVQRILALKRHEQPPPAFFQGFSEKVIDRIQSAGPAPKLTLRARLSVEFYGVPIYVCAAGVVVFGLLVAGLLGSLRVETPSPKSASAPDNEMMGSEASHAIVPPDSKPPIATTAASKENSGTTPTRALLAVPEIGTRPQKP